MGLTRPLRPVTVPHHHTSLTCHMKAARMTVVRLTRTVEADRIVAVAVEAIELEPLKPKRGLSITFLVGVILFCVCMFHVGVVTGLVVW